jgi:hypothetical protein
MPHVGTRQAGVRPECVPKPVAGRAFTVVRTARPLSKADRSRKDPSRAAPVASRPGFCPLAPGWPAGRTLSGPCLPGTPPLRSVAAPGGWWARPIRERRSP